MGMRYAVRQTVQKVNNGGYSGVADFHRAEDLISWCWQHASLMHTDGDVVMSAYTYVNVVVSDMLHTCAVECVRPTSPLVAN